MKGLTGERKRWPVLINRRRDTPKVSHSKAHNGVFHQAEPGMEYGRSEWRQGKKKRRDSSPHSLCTRFSYCISILSHYPPGLWSYSPCAIQWNCIQKIPLVSFVNMGLGNKEWHIKNGTFSKRIQCRPLLLLCTTLFHPILSPITLSLTPPYSVPGAESRALVDFTGVVVRGAYFATSQVKRGGVCEGQQEKCGPTCHWLSSQLEGLVLTSELQSCPTPLIC